MHAWFGVDGLRAHLLTLVGMLVAVLGLVVQARSAATSERSSSMRIGSFLNAFPPAFFLVVHLAAFIVGAYFASRAFSAGTRSLGWSFTLFAIAEIVYMTYHLDWTVFLFAHTIAEVLELAAFILVFVGAVQTSVARLSARAARA